MARLRLARNHRRTLHLHNLVCRHPPVTATALLGLLSPLVAAIPGAGIAGEALSVFPLIGFALALIAMVAGQVTPLTRGSP